MTLNTLAKLPFRTAFQTGLALWLWSSGTGWAAEYLHWHSSENKVDAEIHSWNLRRTLEGIGSSTGWQIFIEPGTERTVSTTFKDRPPGEALTLLLGSLSYALLPQSNGPPRLLVFSTAVHEATQPVPAPPKVSRAITNELVFTYKGRENLDALAKRLDGTIAGRIDTLGAYRLKFETEEAARQAREELQLDSDVSGLDFNYQVDRPPPAERVSISSLPPLSLNPDVSTDTSRLVVGLIDTSVQAQGSQVKDFLLPGIAIAGQSAAPSSSPSHGTSMAETILRGVALAYSENASTPVRLLPVDVYGPSDQTTTFNVAQGIHAAIEAGATIINLSLSSSGNTSFLQTLIQNARQQGVIFFAAAGNEPTASPTYPAAYNSVVAVTAGDKKGQVAAYANFGSFVDVVAPGSTLVHFNNRTFYISGTSAATAYMSGMAAGLAAMSGKSPAQVEGQLRSSFAFKANPDRSK